jgi:hypothetical protein
MPPQCLPLEFSCEFSCARSTLKAAKRQGESRLTQEKCQSHWQFAHHLFSTNDERYNGLRRSFVEAGRCTIDSPY